MVNKKFWLGMLVIVLVFGMMVIGCDDGSTDDNGGERDTTPLPPTGLSGTADGNSVQLTWQSVESASVYSVEYRKEYAGDYQAVNDLTSTSYTVTGLDSNANYQFRVAALNTKGEKSGYSTVVTVKTSDPKTGTVSISLSTTHRVTTMSTMDGPTQNHSYSITVELKLSAGGLWVWESADLSTVRTKSQLWADLTPPSGFSFDNTTFISGLNTLLVRYNSSINSSELPAPNVTAIIEQSKLSEMKGYTNITDSLTLGTPSTASSNAWVDSN